jgi:hypothetical protein
VLNVGELEDVFADPPSPLSFNSYLEFSIDNGVDVQKRESFVDRLNWNADFVNTMFGTKKGNLQIQTDDFGTLNFVHLCCLKKKDSTPHTTSHLQVLLGSDNVVGVPESDCYMLTSTEKRISHLRSQSKIKRKFLHNTIEFMHPLPPPMKISPFLMDVFLSVGIDSRVNEKNFFALIVELTGSTSAGLECETWGAVLATLGYPGITFVPDSLDSSLIDARGVTTRSYFPVAVFLSAQRNVKAVEAKTVYSVPPLEEVPDSGAIPFPNVEHPSEVPTTAANSASSGNSRKLQNYDANWQIQGDALVAWSNNLFGADQIVGCSDTGIAKGSCFFDDDKIVDYIAYADGEASSSGVDHGTHVVGTILGNTKESYFDYWNGVAPDAKVAFFDVSDGSAHLVIPTNFYGQVLSTAYMKGARIHSNSWGSGMNYYDSISRQVDRFTYNYQDMLVLFAVGNDGRRTTTSWESYIESVPTLLNSTNQTILNAWWDQGGTAGAPSVCKNSLAIGSVVNMNQDLYLYEKPQFLSDSGSVSAFSSYGPTFDGRIKPDLVAAGQYVFSADSRYYCGLAGLGGTSMATPVAAGAATLVREYFTKGYYTVGEQSAREVTNPPSALIKAMLINSGQVVQRVLTGSYGKALTSTLYDEYQGFGRISLEHILRFPDTSFDTFAISTNMTNQLTDDLAFEPIFQDGSSATHTYAFQTLGDFKISIVWMDPPAQANVGQTLVNDLDLFVTDLARGTVHYPNGKSSKDYRNNVEQVWLTGLDEGIVSDFEVTVSGAGLRQGPQPYAMVVTADQIHTVKVNGTSITDSGDVELHLLEQNGYLWSADRNFRANEYSQSGNSGLWSDGSEWVNIDAESSEERIRTREDAFSKEAHTQDSIAGAQSHDLSKEVDVESAYGSYIIVGTTVFVFVGLMTIVGILKDRGTAQSDISTGSVDDPPPPILQHPAQKVPYGTI